MLTPRTLESMGERQGRKKAKEEQEEEEEEEERRREERRKSERKRRKRKEKDCSSGSIQREGFGRRRSKFLVIEVIQTV